MVCISSFKFRKKPQDLKLDHFLFGYEDSYIGDIRARIHQQEKVLQTKLGLNLLFDLRLKGNNFLTNVQLLQASAENPKFSEISRYDANFDTNPISNFET